MINCLQKALLLSCTVRMNFFQQNSKILGGADLKVRMMYLNMHH